MDVSLTNFGIDHTSDSDQIPTLEKKTKRKRANSNELTQMWNKFNYTLVRSRKSRSDEILMLLK